ncbi:uncharacterized protein BO88DRAFT_155924 [Aspergillus vadensis CBS 113365]|uniref:Uncharacterized protein n=1 Tax=Aspergillus vadensis (strain CBS 113365 / IMI 142717 / IBT 24658) TaxID=1448311 RepID=A0A319AX78_ASPVC|nr:hypothetical protein BO88DRAFT_155924 [Aspergillus vadensis CBS 113365]PYH64897.1 hypothetical protein BO88DRAFT_155924 [Aspergillus vadensis CBS 113365]
MIDNWCGCGFESSDSFHKFQMSSNSPSSVLRDIRTTRPQVRTVRCMSWVGLGWFAPKANRSAAVWSIRLGGEMTRISERFAVGKRKKSQCFASDVHNVCSQRIHQRECLIPSTLLDPLNRTTILLLVRKYASIFRQALPPTTMRYSVAIAHAGWILRQQLTVSASHFKQSC